MTTHIHQLMTVERIHPKAPVMLIFIAIFTCLPSCIILSNTLSHDYATIYGSCICITCGAKVRRLRTLPIYVRGHVIINRHFDKKSRDQISPITTRVSGRGTKCRKIPHALLI